MLGKGYAEYESIKYALENSKFVNEEKRCSHIVKMTGRYSPPDFLEIMEHFRDRDIDLILQSAAPIFQIRSGIVRSEGEERDVMITTAFRNFKEH